MRGLVNLSKAPGVLVVAAPDQSHLVEELRRAGCRACVSTRSGDTVVRALDMLSAGREFFPDWRNSDPGNARVATRARAPCSRISIEARSRYWHSDA